MGEAKATVSPGWLVWLRALPRTSVLVFCAVLLAAVQAVLGLLEASVWIRVVGTVLVAAVGVASELDKLRTRRREEWAVAEKALETQAAAEAEWLRRVQECLRLWPAPTVADVDPYALGVARSSLAERHTAGDGETPPYVERDIDQAAQKRLRASGLVLIVGTPASGATRTAYQLALADPQAAGRLVLAPQAPDGLRRALDDLDVLSRLAPRTRLLLWLDRVDRFDEHGLTAAMLRRRRERSPGLRVVATIPSTRYETWATEQSGVAEE